jgi:carboxymethylenebutenolidase
MKEFIVVLRIALLSVFVGACATVPPAPGGPSATGPSERLEATPRHDEWIEIANGAKKIRAYVVHPERSTPAPVVVLIHENRGLNDWARSLADQVAAEGYLVVAPDFLSGMAPNGGGTREFESQDAAREAISRLTPAAVLSDLQAVMAHGKTIPSAGRSMHVAGFCWGGARAWEAANGIDGLASVHVFYGTGPQSAEGVASIEAPVFGYYGGDDARVNATIPKTEALMKEAGKTFVYEIHPGAGHAYMRAGEDPAATQANRDARSKSWKVWMERLRTHSR